MPDVKAPYNFVPLNENVFFPSWAKLVSHDVPFKEGLSGKIALKITAESPIFIRKEYEQGDHYINSDGKEMPPENSNTRKLTSRNNDERVISTEFCHIKESGDRKRYYIPGSSIRNMLRSVFEIFTFSKLNTDLFTDRRYGVRDFQNLDVYTLLNNTDEIRIGYLVKKENGYTIYDKGIPVKKPHSGIYFDITHNKKTENISFKEYFSEQSVYNTKIKKEKEGKEKKEEGDEEKEKRYTLLSRAKTAKYKYELYKKEFDSTNENYVFTGQPGFNDHTKGKQNEFWIKALDEQSDRPIEVSETAYQDFKFIYNDYEGSTNISTDWEYWKKRLEQKKAIPVFFRIDPNSTDLIDFGLSFLYKMAYKNRILKAIKNIQPNFNSHEPDLTDCVFGTKSEKGIGLKGRIHVAHAFSDNAETVGKSYSVVLATPKASYYPFYVNQSVAPNTELTLEKYSTYHDDNVKIKGRKRYPLCEVNIDANLAKDNQGKVSTTLRPLRKGTIFTTELSFHNLLPCELGAVLSAITFHDTADCRHSIGSGKPFGLGRIKVEITKTIGFSESDKISLMGKFENALMEQIGNLTKQRSITELVTMASINSIEDNSHHGYMPLIDFPKIKTEKKALPHFSSFYNTTQPINSLNTKKEVLPPCFNSFLIFSKINSIHDEINNAKDKLSEVKTKISVISKEASNIKKLESIHFHDLEEGKTELMAVVADDNLKRVNIHIDGSYIEAQLITKYMNIEHINKGDSIRVVIQQLSQGKRKVVSVKYLPPIQ